MNQSSSRGEQAATAAIRAAFMRSRTGHTQVERALRQGTIDNRGLARVASDDLRCCRRRRLPNPGEYRIWLMVDCSGSMMGSPIIEATRVAHALAAASRFLTNVQLEIFGWSDAFKRTSYTYATFGVCRVWKNGDPISNVGYLPGLPQGGTPDGEVVRWATREMPRHLRGTERGVLIIASDGQGGLTPQIIAKARKAGLDVISIAIGPYVRESMQEEVYGRGNYITWKGSVAQMARPLGILIGKIAQGGRR